MTTRPELIRVNGQLYRLAKNISDDEVKESIEKAADKAAIENIVLNLVTHAERVQELAPQVFQVLDDKRKADKLFGELKDHANVLQQFLKRMGPTYSRYHSKHEKKGGGKKKAPVKKEAPKEDEQ
jgi:hypothetical protein